MNTVEPIRDLSKLNECFKIARAHDDRAGAGTVSWELLMVLGFNTGLRVSDIVRLRVNDLYLKEFVYVKAKKTGKMAKISFSKPTQRDLRRLLRNRPGGMEDSRAKLPRF